ncbi:MAG: phosphoheptose isomerase [Rhodocyclaceae bacterium]|jgi:D-sedoheptulose 7-phosphate isomerase|nr:phosphoheptose isomerase [Rhodocyclaceae bacterium]MCE2980230.1 phosphoheptose isomerase [Betaproteobacteria bacterium]MCA3075441.1 phosphoheptose isomerase [Rhodocyclaceae bacterium]MCA3091926.1 phosphoheptose isomerase [Rhodocyclaceae bacterium]MCA3093180.1 phosphoheptose isomerase [Rhodocyclaceae bacterium]
MEPKELLERIAARFEESARLKREVAPMLAEPILAAGRAMAATLAAGGRVLACGNGGSAADAQHFAAELLNRFECERPPLAAIALTTDSSTLTSIANDYDYRQVFSKQVRALGRGGDVLLAISTSGNSPNVLAAIEAARAAGMRVVALTGRDGGSIGRSLADGDIELRVPHPSTAHVQEIHILALHCVCDAIDQIMFPEEAQ